MNLIYASAYTRLLAKATKHRNRKHGINLGYGGWCMRLHPDDDKSIQFGFWPRATIEWPVRTEKGELPFWSWVTMGPQSMEIMHPYYNPKVVPPEFAAKYPDLKVHQYRSTHKGVDTTLNNLLSHLLSTPKIFHRSVREKQFDGFEWGYLSGGYHLTECQKIVGPVVYNALTNTLTPQLTQPERVVDKAKRKEVNDRLRKASQHLRLLARMEVQFTKEDFQDEVGDAPSSKYTDPGVLFDKLETTDLSNQGEVLELVVRCAAVVHHSRWFYKSAANSWWELSKGMIHTDSQLRQIRKKLQEHLRVVRYEI